MENTSWLGLRLFLWGESQILFHLFVAHRFLPMVEFTEFMAQKDKKYK